MKKVYVMVDCERQMDGSLKPAVIHWSDGRSWRVKKTLHVSMPANGEFAGVRYTIVIGNVERYLYKDAAGWYVIPLRKGA